jgi:hypothetical protein
MKFRYFKQGDAVGDNGKVIRAFAEEAVHYLTRLIRVVIEEEDGSLRTVPVKHNNVSIEVPQDKTPDEARKESEEAGNVFKYHEVSFKDWEYPSEWEKDAEGRVIDPGYGPLDMETGEPVNA